MSDNANFRPQFTGPVITPDDIFRPNLAAEIDDTRTWVDPNGYRLSQRLWKAGSLDRAQIESTLRAGLAAGASPLQVARAVEGLLNPSYQLRRDPETFRPLPLSKQPKGVATKTPRQGPGRGIFRPRNSGIGNYAARRLARTETTRAFGAATLRASKGNPLMERIRWRLSGHHHDSDDCDRNAERGSRGQPRGVYFVDEVPRYPNHPHEMCTLNPYVTNDDIADAIPRLREYIRTGELPPRGFRGDGSPLAAVLRPIDGGAAAPITANELASLVPRFKSKQEAIDWLKANTGGSVTEGRIGLPVIQAIADGFGKSLVPYGAKLKGVNLSAATGGRSRGVVASYSTLRRDPRTVPGVIGFSPSRISSLNAALREAKEQADIFSRKKARDVATFSNAIEKAEQYGLSEQALIVNRDLLERAEATKRWAVYTDPDITNPIEAITIHESGHAIFAQRELKERWLTEFANIPKIDQYRVSEYGASSYEELFTEGFTAMKMGIEIPVTVRGAIERVLDGTE